MTQIPGPKGSLITGHLKDFAELEPNQFFENLYRDYPEIAKFRLVNYNCVLVSDPELIKAVLLTNNKSYIKDRFFWDHTKPLLGQSLLTTSGDEWKMRRKLSAPAFHKKTLENYVEFVHRYSEEILSTYEHDQAIDMYESMGELTGHIIVKALFDSDTKGLSGQIHHAITDTTDVIRNRLNSLFKIPFSIPTPDNRKYMNGVKTLDNLVYQFIEEHRSAGAEKQTLLASIMNARDEDGNEFSDHQLRNEAITLFLAGHETTSLTLTWAWYLLSQNPQAEQALHRELDTVLQGRIPTSADLSSLPYTRSVIKESMRIFPPAFTFSREAIEDNQIGPYTIRKGDVVFVSPWALNRNEANFPEPSVFKPERWTPEFEKSLHRYTFVPFGGGPRICIGENFAMMEAMIILAMFAQKYRFKYEASEPPEPFQGITLRPAGGLPMRIEARKPRSTAKQDALATAEA